MTQETKKIEDAIREIVRAAKEMFWLSFDDSCTFEEGLNKIQDELVKSISQLIKVVKTDTAKVTRVEVIDHTKNLEQGGGRVYVNTDENNKVELSLQDEGRTLKIFISKK